MRRRFGGLVWGDSLETVVLSLSASVVSSLQRRAALIADLRYWMSTIEVASQVGQDRIANAEEIRASVDKLLVQ